MSKNDVKFVLTHEKQILSLAQVAGETFKINHKLNCDNKCLFIFLLASAAAKTICWRNHWEV